MAILKEVEADLRKQREMIEGLIARVTAHEARVDDPEATIPPAQPDLVEFMQTTKLSTFESPKPAAPPPAPKPPAPAPAAPLMSDDLFAQIAGSKPAPAPAFDPMATQKLPPGAEKTQILDAQATQKLPPNAEKTQMLDAQATQKLPPGAEKTQILPSDSEVTQRIDDSIWRLQEAKRILSGINNR